MTMSGNPLNQLLGHMPRLRMTLRLFSIIAGTIILTNLFAVDAFAHGVDEKDAAFLTRVTGFQFVPFVYLGAKHMVTGYDHLLFLVGVIFFLYKFKDIGLYVSLFAVGHSTTLLLGVLADVQVNAFIIDAIIGLSIVYKAFENMGGFNTIFGINPDTKKAVLIFGFFHGFGLATKIQEFNLSSDGLVANIISFNVGVEIGQFAALAIVLLLMNLWRMNKSFMHTAFYANILLMASGFMFMGYQITGYVTTI
jgi:HupE / UreJ protein